MRTQKYKILLFLGFIATASVQAQEMLSPDAAVALAIENNYHIKLAKNNLEIDEINVNRGNAGMLPALTGGFNLNNNITNSKQERTDGTVQELNGAQNNSMNYGVNLKWTVFDGFSMFAKYDQLKEIQKQGEAELKFNVVTLASQVLSAYFDLVQQQQVLQAYEKAIELSEMRLDLAQNRYQIGKAAKLEVLNAKVDLNADKTDVLRQQERIQNAQTTLNLLMAQKLDTPIAVQAEWEINQQLLLDDLMVLSEKQNPQLQMALINQNIAEQELRKVKGNRYPQIALTSGYNFTRSESSLGFARMNNGHGLNYGVSVSMNLFNGLIQKRNERIAKVQIENAQVQTAQQKQDIEAQLRSSFQTYLTNLHLMVLEENNEEIAKENLDITLEKFKIGSTTTVEVRTAQQNYIDAITRVNDAKYQAKVSEIKLRELAGNVLD